MMEPTTKQGIVVVGLCALLVLAVTFQSGGHSDGVVVSPLRKLAESSCLENEEPTPEMLKSVLDTPTIATATKVTADGRIDWSQYDRIQLLHTRKAGGTTLRSWAPKLAKKFNLTYGVLEGVVYDGDDWKPVGDNPRTLVFTSLRDPVSRVKSSYEFDALYDTHSNQHNITLREFVYTNFEKDYNLAERPQADHFFKQVGSLGFNHEYPVKRGWLWACSAECYSKWFGGWPLPKPETGNPLPAPRTKTALQNLDEMEIIFVSSLKNEEYMNWLLHRFDAEDIPLLKAMPMGQKSEHHKRSYTRSEESLMESYNWRDRMLYEAIREKWSKFTTFDLV